MPNHPQCAECGKKGNEQQPLQLDEGDGKKYCVTCWKALKDGVGMLFIVMNDFLSSKEKNPRGSLVGAKLKEKEKELSQLSSKAFRSAVFQCAMKEGWLVSEGMKGLVTFRLQQVAGSTTTTTNYSKPATSNVAFKRNEPTAATSTTTQNGLQVVKERLLTQASSTTTTTNYSETATSNVAFKRNEPTAATSATTQNGFQVVKERPPTQACFDKVQKFLTPHHVVNEEAASPQECQAPRQKWLRVGQRDSNPYSLLFGHVRATTTQKPDEVCLCGAHPFTMLIFGKQGSGKSNTQNVVMENHLMPDFVEDKMEGGSYKEERSSSKLKPFATMAFHYEPSNVVHGCEFLGLCENSSILQQTLVLTSPTFPAASNFYEEHGFRTAKLKLKWEDFTASHLMALMRIDPKSPQLYMSTMMKMLRRYQKDEKQKPPFKEFKAECLESFSSPSQSGPLQQRLDLLEDFVADPNQGDFTLDLQRELEGNDTTDYPGGRLIVVDLTDPLLSAADANAFFFVLLSMFRATLPELIAKPPPPHCRFGGKLVVFDEAHLFFVDPKSDLCLEIDSLVATMRHENMRVIITTQLPSVIPNQLFQLATFTVLHHFHTPTIWAALQKEYHQLEDSIFDELLNYAPGEGILISPIDLPAPLTVRIRRRYTADIGYTKHATLAENASSQGKVPVTGATTMTTATPANDTSNLTSSEDAENAVKNNAEEDLL